ncbi:MAG: PKD domain-containing protein [Phycisphaerae bacterium]|nr:PKD domain-containing protein [Phycisphaerae bacterium]
MTVQRRGFRTLWPLASVACGLTAAWFATTASAEERKLAVLLGYPIKQDNGGSGNSLPNANDVFDAYFDKVKNGRVNADNPDGVQVDSHAEWWEEISYGDVTVSGNVFGWVNLPWRTRPNNISDCGSAAVPICRVPHVDLNGSVVSYAAGVGETFNNRAAKFRYDFDGVGTTRAFAPFANATETTGPNANNPGANIPRIQPAGSKAKDAGGFDVFTPGERFLDLNNNRIYDAGVFEWGIDKNGNGIIDIDRKATSYAQLFDSCIQFPRDEMGEPLNDDGTPNPEYLPELELAFMGWANNTEWYDSNGDGEWDKDGFGSAYFGIYEESIPSFSGGDAALNQFPCVGGERTGTPPTVELSFHRGDWSATEVWIDRNQDFALGGRAVRRDEFRGDAGNTDGPALVFEFLIGLADPDSDEVEYFDEQWNANFDFPEPFEDHLRKWDAAAHQFVPTEIDYIKNNYPGDPAALTALIGDDGGTPNDPSDDTVGRIGNRRYDASDAWTNTFSSVNASNKVQFIQATPDDATESAAFNLSQQYITPEPEFYTDNPPSTGPAGWSLDEFWEERFGPDSTPPMWNPTVPYFRRFEPGNPVIRLAGDSDDRRFEFRATNGGPVNAGVDFNGNQYTEASGTVLPNISDGRDGFFDGPAEFADLPSSIYHQAGDGGLGEVTGPGGDLIYGSDVGVHDPQGGGGVPDQIIPAAGPLAFNVHGDQGYDGGNVLNLEVLTWNSEGATSTDDVIEIPAPDLDGDGVPDDLDNDGQPDDPIVITIYHRDTNLDGLMDLGETIGEQGVYATRMENPFYSYGVSPIQGQSADGNPSNLYPFNRTRCMEDMVEALDDVVDWDDFLGGPGQFGNDILGLLLLPEGTGPGGMFTLPASGRHLIRTRDIQDASAVGSARYTPLSFFDGMGIEIGGLGEGGGLQPTGFQTGFAGHEYGHIWEGWPDLYDYDVRAQPPLNIVNNPVAVWCVMAGGGLVHPVPILKADSGWINPIDITRALTPNVNDTLVIRPWEFDRNKNIFQYTNPLFPGEQYWYWATSEAKPDPEFVNFDSRGLPGLGLMVMRTDRGSNLESLPPQQRIAAGRFTYQIIQADGEQRLENGQNFGDAGDPFPGTSNRRIFTRNTDPAARWGNGAASGLDVLDIQRNETSGVITVRFKWSPRELPSLEWVRPPEFGQPGEAGLSVGGIYQVRTRTFDQFGGTRIDFFAAPFEPGSDLAYLPTDIQVGTTTKQPGDADTRVNAEVFRLADGTYTFYARLVPGVGADGRAENEFSLPRAGIDNFGDGILTVQDVDTAISFYETWTVRCTNANPPGQETWSVSGTISGPQADARTGTVYSSNADSQGRRAVRFLIQSRVLPFRVGDEFLFVTTGYTPHSAAVLVNDGEVVLPEPPDAQGRLAAGAAAGLAPHTVSFKHDGSTDPFGAALNFRWDFGDNSDVVETADLNALITHTYTTPRTSAYEARLTVTNIFGLSDTVVIPIQVNAAQPPNVRLEATPRSGDVPLVVQFSAEGTTDPNAGTTAIDYVWDFGDGSPLSTAARNTHTYNAAGIYVARVTATNRPYNRSASQSVEIRVGGSVNSNFPPIAQIDVDRTLGPAPLRVLFNGDGSSDPENGTLEYSWDFGDGSPVVRGASSVEHTFERVGTFVATLTVRDNVGQQDPAAVTITVSGNPLSNNQAPVARATTSSRQGAAPFVVRFDASDSRDPEGQALRYEWDFGDGSPKVESVVAEHTYTKAQAYIAVLRVTDPLGAAGAVSLNILVNAPAGGQSGQDNPDDGGTDGGGDGGGVSGPPICGLFGFSQLTLMLAGLAGARRWTGHRG